ncbi:MAG: molybdopterin molybdotransferase MoeA, partial [Gemmatimonadaceae bacterium]|nr:molybdopterin molybdotransferase MoeA [Gemmatimonadaceae bacterium]
MISVDEALARIVANVRRLPPREVALLDAVDRFAARDVSAGLSLPPFDNSSVDGYAVMAASCAIGTRLKVVGEQAAGPDRSLSIQPGEALRILTGAPLPAGADAVIMQEETEREGNEVLLKAEVRPGEFVRQRGGDVTEGQKLLAAGERVRTQTVALLAAQGMSSLQVGGEVQATVVSTGDELVAPGSPLRAGQIYESNSILLQAMLTKCGVDVVSVTHCQDRAEEIEAALRAGARCDVMVITGG